MRTVGELLEMPITTVAASSQIESKPVAACLAVYRRLPETAQSNVAHQVENFAARIRAIETVSSDLNDLAKATGLLKMQDSASTLSQPEELSAIRAVLAQWSAQTTGAQALDLNALAEGQRGTLLLPYYDLKGQEAQFRLPMELFMAGDGKSLRDLMRSMTTAEMEETAKAAAQRLHNAYDGTLERLEQYNMLAKYLKLDQESEENTSAQWDNWLKQVNLVQVAMLDERGQSQGTKQMERSNFENVCDAWQTAASCRQLEAFYLQLAKNARDAQNNRDFQTISDRCLIDSLLREWQLAFSDEATEQRFEEWSVICRTKAWEVIWQQALANEIDPLVFFNESTVFHVREDHDSFVISPMYVANILSTRCVRDTTKGVVRYDSPWQARRPTMYNAQNTPSAAETPAALAQATTDTVLKSVQSIAAGFAVKEFLEIIKDLETHLPLEQWRTDLQLAFCAAPEVTAAMLTEAALSLWPDPPKNDLKQINRIKLRKLTDYESLEEDYNQQWNSIDTQLQDGSWPFADQYALFVLVFRQEAEARSSESGKRTALELAELLEKNGRKVDAAFMDRILEKGKIDERSDGYQEIKEAYELWTNERSALSACNTIMLLGEADRLLDGHRSADSILHRMILLENDLAKHEGRKQRDLKARTDLKTDDKDYAQSVVSGWANDFEQTAKRLSGDTQSEGDNQAWHLAARCQLLAQQAGRIAIASTDAKENRSAVITILEEAAELLRTEPSNHAEWFAGTATNTVRELQHLAQKLLSGEFDALARRQLQAKLSDISSPLAKTTIAHLQRTQRESPNQRTLEFLVQLTWGMGQYRQAFELLTSQTMQQLATDMETESGATRLLHGLTLLHLFSEVQDNLLKACVYSGGDFFGTSIFGKRQSDWVAQPRDLSEVVTTIEVHLPGSIEKETSEQFAELRERVVAGKAPALSPEQPQTIGEYHLTGSRALEHDGVCEFDVEGPCGLGLLRVSPNDKEGLPRSQALAGTELAAKLARTTATAPKHLLVSSGENPLVYSDERVVITLEMRTEAGQQETPVLTAHEHQDFPDQLYLSNGHWVDTQDQEHFIAALAQDSLVALPADATDLCAQLRRHPAARAKNLRFFVTAKANRGAANMQRMKTATFSPSDTEFFNESEVQDLVVEQDDSVVLFVRAGRDSEKAQQDLDQKLQRAFDANRFAGKRIALIVCDNEKSDRLTRLRQDIWLANVRERTLQSGASLFCAPSQVITDEAGKALIEATRKVLKSDKNIRDLSEVLDEATQRVRSQQSDEEQPGALPEAFRMDPFTYSPAPMKRGPAIEIERIRTQAA